METDPDDTERMLRDTFRGWFTSELAPHVPAMEDGSLTPYALMRTMHRTLGLDATLTRPSSGTAEGGATASGGLDANVARYARTTFVVEMARVSPSFALSWGASTGLHTIVNPRKCFLLFDRTRGPRAGPRGSQRLRLPEATVIHLARCQWLRNRLGTDASRARRAGSSGRAHRTPRHSAMPTKRGGSPCR